MSTGDERSLGEQLIDARAKIVVQLDKMRNPVTQGRAGGPPDFRDQIAELEGQLREIEALLSESEDDDP